MRKRDTQTENMASSSETSRMTARRHLPAWLICLLMTPLLLGPLSTSSRPAQAPSRKPAAKPAAAEAEEEEQLPPPQNIEAFTPDDWLNRVEPFDRLIISHHGKTIILDVYPIDERPLELHPGAKQMQIGKPDTIRVVPVGTGEEYEVLRQYIKEVKHWEDLLLEQGEKYLKQGDLGIAFDFYHRVATRSPWWPGLSRKLQDFLSEEARIRRLRHEHERALVLLHELSQLNPNYPNLKKDIGITVDHLIATAYEDRRDYRMARHYLGILKRDYADHPIALKWERRMSEDAGKLVREALAADRAGNARDACLKIQQAAHIWPDHPIVKEQFDRLFGRYPILYVGVRDLPRRFDPWAPPGTADNRVARLLYVPLTEVTGVGENTKFSYPLLDGEPQLTELGRRIVIQIRPGLRWSDGLQPITAMDVSRALTARCNPDLPGYDAALASVLTDVSVPQPYQVVVDLNRTQLRPQTDFLFYLSGSVVAADESDVVELAKASSSGPYRVLERTSSEARFQANKFYFSGKPKIAEIVERPYPDARRGIEALLAGDVALLEHVPARYRKRLERHGNIKIIRCGVPALHVIAFDFRRPEFHSRTLRRAMAAAIDRLPILEKVLLEAKSDDENCLVNGPFPRGTYAYEPSVPEFRYEPELAAGLASVAKRELGRRNIRLTLHYPDVDEARLACKYIKVYWEKILGITIELRPWPYQELEEQIALGRRFDLVYRIIYVADPVLDAARVLCLGPPITREGMAMPNCASAWLRQLLSDLALATDWKTAREKLRDIQFRARSDVAIIPLWQMTDYYAYDQALLGGPQDGAPTLYHNVQNWEAKPWLGARQRIQQKQEPRPKAPKQKRKSAPTQ